MRNLGDTLTILNFARDNSLENIKKIIIKGCYTGSELNDMRDNNLNTPLHLAVLNSNIEMIEFLMRCKMDIHKKNKFRRSSWDLAILIRDSNIIDKFVKSMISSQKKNLKNSNLLLQDENKNLMYKINILKNSDEINKKKIKDISNDLLFLNHKYNDILENNKKLKLENDELKEKNNNLTKSVDSMISSKKRKLF